MESQRGANVNTMGPAGARTPGCAVARSGSRVVAIRQDPPTTSFDRRVYEVGCSPTAAVSWSRAQSGMGAVCDSYEPYVHVVAGERALVQVRADPATGRRVLVAPLPDLYVPQAVMEQLRTAQQLQHDQVGGCFASLVRCLRGHDVAADDTSVDAPVGAVSAAVPSPVAPRQLQFGIDGGMDGEEFRHLGGARASMKLSTKTLEKLDTTLELVLVNDFLIDFKAAIGNVDADAFRLLDAVDWRALLDGSPRWAVDANRRIAEGLFAAFDSGAPNVKRLKSVLRAAESGVSPGIMSSGMDIVEEVRGLVHGRSAGEVKMDAKEGDGLVFKVGAPMSVNRSIADSIEQHFAIRSPAERAVENGILHLMISKVPLSTDPLLAVQKRMYENDLHKAEMASPPQPPPWSVRSLVDMISVDLASVGALASKEVSTVDKGGAPAELHSKYACANCGVVGQHISRDCPTKCLGCKFSFCPGAAQAKVCAVSFDVIEALAACRLRKPRYGLQRAPSHRVPYGQARCCLDCIP